ncbi:MAG TPA: 2,3-diphosphoglycerate-dependent phosphoglycerate mutase [Bacteroidales bacterium]|nr:2,3-diphosphoglycerate-dependent phosphoglycerate mutase [Bacteroidales bacterium]HSA43923.1 2,3-diphosphoglycerate-dependent phosphoglycerate mutase [Bacteroidales bacterium]
MYQLVLIRHGESVWNKENRFTGWTDVDLSPAGVEEAREAGSLLKEEGFDFPLAYTSYLKRAIKTLHYILEEMDLLWIPVKKTWRLNEKHYGELQGLNKSEMAARYGEEQVHIWRRSYDVPPAPLNPDDPRHPVHQDRYKNIGAENIPSTESLKDTVARIVPYWQDEMQPDLRKHRRLLVAAHGNSLRGIIKHLKQMSDSDIISLNLPTGIPYVFEFDENMQLTKDYFLGDPEKIRELMEKVASQGKAR